jgi:sialate O-acetylesterase
MVHQDSANFSAVCWLFGRDLQRALKPTRPIGLIESTLGGTSIERWSSTDALATCKHLEKRGELKAGAKRGELEAGAQARSDLYNGMVVPLLAKTIYGVVW